MKIRLGNEDDVNKIAHIVKELWLLHVDKEPEYLNRKYIENADPIKYFQSILGKADSFLFIAEDKNRIVGFLKVDVKEIESFFVSNRILYLDEIYVMKEFRQQGVAKMLMKKAEEFSRGQKITLLKARVYRFNRKAQKAIKSQNYKELYSEYFKLLK